MASSARSRNLSFTAASALACWGGAAAATYLVRWWKRHRLQVREREVLQAGGLLPAARNVVHALELRATHPRTRTRVALVSCDEGDAGQEYTWADYYEEARAFAAALTTSLEHPERKGVAIHAFNCPEWFFCAMGALAAGWTVSGIYLTNTYNQAVHILKTSEVQVLVIETEEMLNTTYRTLFQDFPTGLTVVLLSPGSNFKATDRVVSYADFVRPKNGTTTTGAKPPLPAPRDLSSDAVASLVYTSGTTGNPKAVELTLHNLERVCTIMHARIPLSEEDVIISYLPLSHIAAMGIDLFQTIFCGARVHFADADALRGTLKDSLLKVRPTLFFGVPRVWEKLAAAMQTAAAAQYQKPVSGTVLKAVGSMAKVVGGAWWSYTTPEIVRCALLVVPYTFFKVAAFKKIRRKCGLDRCQLLYTGAAPLPADTLHYLRSVDMPLLEVFGMSESAGAIAVCGPTDAIRPLGACGRALAGGTLTIGADDGEIIWSGDNNMKGYKGLPAATAAVMKKGNALHTGDLGRVDKNGQLFITGRKKDIIITAGGENVAPIPIEENFMSLLAGSAGHVVLIGDQRKFLTLLVGPTENGQAPTEEQMTEALRVYNESLAMSRAQRVQKAHILDIPFSVDSGDLTPTMKLKRNVVVQKYAAEIENMYTTTSSLVGYSSMDVGSLLRETS